MTCPHLLPAAPHTVPLTTAADSQPKGCGRSHTPAGVVATAPPPAHVAELTVAATEVRPPRAASPVGVPEAGAQRPTAMRAHAMLAPSLLHVELEQVPAGQGSRATRKCLERRICGGNCRGAERWRLRGQAMPQAGAAAAPMLCEDGDGDGGAAPQKRPRQDRSEAPGQRRRGAVATPAGPPPAPPASAQSSARTAPTSYSVWAVGGGGHTADSSSLSASRSCSAWAAIKLLYFFFFLRRHRDGGGRGDPVCFSLLLCLHVRVRIHDIYAPLCRGARAMPWIAAAVLTLGGRSLNVLGDQPTGLLCTRRWATHMPPCIPSFLCLILTPAWFCTIDAFTGVLTACTD